MFKHNYAQSKKESIYASYNSEIALLNESVSLVECGYAEVDEQWKDIVAHFSFYRIYFVIEGSAILYLKNSTIELKAGNLYFIPSFEVVACERVQFLKHFYLHFMLDGPTPHILEIHKFVSTVPATKIDEELFKELLTDFSKNDMAMAMRKSGIFQYFLSKFYDNVEYVNKDVIKFEEVLKYITEHLNENLTVKKLASIANMSEVYFSNLFSKTFGISLIKYINQKRMNIAVIMLSENKKNSKEIAYALGYENETYFFKVFKKTFGMTPGQYKEQCIASIKNSKN